jgi:antitoxin (DNA-binding transcriptional repressor) of toxin-antitoxin stability system
VAKGEEFTITMRGKPVARLVPISITQSKPDVRQAIEELKAFSKCNTFGDSPSVRETTDYASINERLEHVEALDHFGSMRHDSQQLKHVHPEALGSPSGFVEDIYIRAFAGRVAPSQRRI